ncbi:LysE family translocator [Sedimenticola hydrogenitrophicus]|uniref:LysE family translocator n=1 Tax=Sedimenticola hydrogenitrophicus TaxID=2967975 RepID=UPI0023AFF3E7|nr:LysE family translocator [Sedimenticola hydrogenitrophicus]
MFETATLLLFVTSAVLLALSPGPDNLFVLTISIARGPLAGVVTTLGLCTGLVVHTGAVALGVAVFIQESALAFSLLKIGGALYLAWLAWQVFRAPAETLGARASGDGYRRLYLRGVLMNIMNPKVSLFFLAFLPQFVSPVLDPALGPVQGSVTLQIVILGLLFMASALLVFGLISLAAGRIGGFLRKGRGGLILNRLSGVVFAGLALKLLLTER